jgi:ParB-like chromosome segregation protein Spo0J
MNPADKVEKWKISKLIPYARNARTHSDEQVGQIAASIKEWGWTTPVLVDEQGGIIAGHGRTLAAQKLEMTEVPVMVAKGWSEAKKRAYVLADNKLALNAGWDNEMLALEFGEIGELGFNLDLTGFSADFIAELTQDQVPELGLLPDEKLENFLNGDTKILRLAYDEQEFESIINALKQLQEKTGVNDFSSIILDLVIKSCEN